MRKPRKIMVDYDSEPEEITTEDAADTNDVNDSSMEEDELILQMRGMYSVSAGVRVLPLAIFCTDEEQRNLQRKNKANYRHLN
jgi:hypothetical protein